MNICLIKISGKSISSFVKQQMLKTQLQNLYDEYDGIVIVHGAGKEITEWSDKFGLESKFIGGQRVTSKEQMKIVAAVQAGLKNSELCAKINAAGFSASGYSGIDRGTFVVNHMNPKLGFVGKPDLIGSIEWIINLLKDNVIPVFSSVCRDKEGNLVNVNADIFAEQLAMYIDVRTVIFLSDVEGVKINGNIEQEITTKDIINGIKSGDITDGMIPKLMSCSSLLENGIEKIWIGLTLNSLFNNKNNIINGTWIKNSGTEYKKLKKTA
jgi:acetylglutamate kinase